MLLQEGLGLSIHLHFVKVYGLPLQQEPTRAIVKESKDDRITSRKSCKYHISCIFP